MRVGILTFHYSHNYGAVLQAYGLSEAIRAMGHSVQVVDYRPLAARQLYTGHWPRSPRRFFPVAALRWKFHSFRQHCLPLSRQTYWTLEDLSHCPPEVDCFVCGSDQVWNIASHRGFDPVFFLEFLGESAQRRVSYAATFGHADGLGGHRERICRLLSRFNDLSVRDIRSQTMVHELTGRVAEHVLDPSFLTNYTRITPRRIFRYPYALIYCVNQTDMFRRAVQSLPGALRIPCISIKVPFDGMKVIHSVGPLQWLSLVRHADFVCTNSFHGTCFSLISRREFVALPVENGLSRIQDLLATAGLDNRLAQDGRQLAGCLSDVIDYGLVSARLREARLRSEAFLRKALV
jgi:hypothetical protein